MKNVFIIHGLAKKKAIVDLMKQIERFDPNARVYPTRYPNHAQEIAFQLSQNRQERIHLFACGGDGLLHEVVNGIRTSKNILLSVVPLGTGNDWIKSFPKYKKQDFQRLSNYKAPFIQVCDLMKIDQEYAINTISFGFDVRVAQYANQYTKKLIHTGIVPYYLGMLRSLFDPMGFESQLTCDGIKLPNANYSFLVFGNGRFYGGGYQPCPEAKMDDGMMDLCMIEGVKKSQIFLFSKSYERGEHKEKFPERVTMRKVKRVQIDTKGRFLEANLDGEVKAFQDPNIEIVPNAILLALPNIE